MSSILSQSLPSPRDLEHSFPLTPDCALSIRLHRAASAAILKGEEERLAVLIGPCSIHNSEEAIEYAQRLKELQKKLAPSFLLIMRVFLEKPRTRMGWKGLLYDPHLDGSNDLAEGLYQSRKLLQTLGQMGVPCATEFLDPLVSLYLSDFITWGLIGARTSASQPHRQLASGLPFPIGFKNSVDGDLDPALSAVVTARMPHTHFSLDPDGRVIALQTTGNPLAHLVLRGSETLPNFDPLSIQDAQSRLRQSHLDERLLIDCAHGNSGKDLERQQIAFRSAIDQISGGSRVIRGLMVESNLIRGKQPLGDEPDKLQRGLSITDPCLGWEETEELLLWGSDRFQSTLSKSGASKSP